MIISELDFSAFETSDYVNIILQRSDILHDVKRPGRVIRSWVSGDETLVSELAQEQGPIMAQRALTDISNEFETILDKLEDWNPSSVADIGCGYGFFGWYAAQVFHAKTYLIDIEQSEARGFGFSDVDRGYTDLSKAERFLTANGVPAKQFELINPNETDLSSVGQVDLATSFLACGFHFPVDDYMDFFEKNVAPGGRIILDLRQKNEKAQLAQLETLGAVSVLVTSNNRSRVMVVKPA